MKLARVSGGDVDIADTIFARPYNEALVHQVVVSYQAAGRQGTKAQKTRAQVRGGGKKPWKQKGSGRARAGSSRSPIWRSGGKAFAAVPRDFQKQVNRKMYRGAMQCIFSQLIREDRLHVVNEISVENSKTKSLVAKLESLGMPEALIIVKEVSPSLYLSARNLVNVEVRDVQSVDPVSLIAYAHVIITEDAIMQCQERLSIHG
jgi:large subunit ribosomal protein L4